MFRMEEMYSEQELRAYRAKYEANEAYERELAASGDDNAAADEYNRVYKRLMQR